MQAGLVTTTFAESLSFIPRLDMLDSSGISSHVDNAAGFQYPLKT